LQIDIALSFRFYFSDAAELRAAKSAAEPHEHIAASTANCGKLALEVLLRSLACPALVIFGVPDASSKDRNGCAGSLALATRNTIDVPES
jgi:hypothetical protein